MRNFACGSLLIAMAIVSPASAAEQSIAFVSVSGKVMVNNGSGYLAGAAGQSIADGSRIFVGKGAEALVASADAGCQVALPEGKVTVINAKMLCEPGAIVPTGVTGNAAFGRALLNPPKWMGLTFTGAVFTTGFTKLVKDLRRPVSVP